MKQQTAVEWLESELDFLYQYMAERDRSKLFEQAKAMEKEQIVKGYFKGHCDGYNAGVSVYDQVEFQSAEQYYNETYKNK
jgi:hypothetical protein